MDTSAAIRGYDFGRVPRSPVTLDDLVRLKASASLGEDDERALKQAGAVLVPQAEAMVDAWRAKIGQQPHLAAAFAGRDGRADERYKSQVKPRFVRWIVDLCTRPFDQSWLDYQHEIGLRHTPAKKNLTDGAQAAPVVSLRDLLAFGAEVIVSVRPRLAAAGLAPAEVERQHAAWTKAVMLSLTLWSAAYTREGLW
jgi:hypothetical protein